MEVFYATILAFLFLIPQSLFRLSWEEWSYQPHLINLLIIYIAFHFRFLRGLISTLLVGFILESFSVIPHGLFIIVALILFIAIHSVTDQIYSEAYLTKMGWIFGISIIFHWMTQFVLGVESVNWLELLVISLFDSVLGFFLFIALDFLFEMLDQQFASKRSEVTGADLYHARSKQRRFI